MKDGIHPNYREVVFLDTSCDFGFVTRSTVATNETTSGSARNRHIDLVIHVAGSG